MERLLVLLVSLVLVSFCRGEDWQAPDFCHQKKCPEFKLIKKYEDYEERLYKATEWITTKIQGTKETDAFAAHERLKEYCQARHDIPTDTWPVVVSATADHEYFLSWFLPPGTKKPENTDPLITLQSKPEATVYVRIFGGTPSINSGQEEANKLLHALKRDCPDLPSYSGAGYDLLFSLRHHNEIWINADDIHCKKAE
ncbi:uncharacterized protein ABDE67_013663 [Symphorus nematophorus]